LKTFSSVEPPPPNVLTINDEFDAAMTLKWLQMKQNIEGKKKRKEKKIERYKKSYI